jgi:hypothetical protein
MGSIDYQAFTRKARPILWQRDYEAAKSVLIRAAANSSDERFMGLLQALHDYERSGPNLELSRIVELAECVFVPVLTGDHERSRRWSDEAI